MNLNSLRAYIKDPTDMHDQKMSLKYKHIDTKDIKIHND